MMTASLDLANSADEIGDLSWYQSIKLNNKAINFSWWLVFFGWITVKEGHLSFSVIVGHNINELDDDNTGTKLLLKKNFEHDSWLSQNCKLNSSFSYCHILKKKHSEKEFSPNQINFLLRFHFFKKFEQFQNLFNNIRLPILWFEMYWAVFGYLLSPTVKPSRFCFI